MFKTVIALGVGLCFTLSATAEGMPPPMAPEKLIQEMHKPGVLDAARAQAVAAGEAAGSHMAKTLDQAGAVSAEQMETFAQFQRAAKEAMIKGYPKRDQALARAILLEGKNPATEARIYYFVSRSMPEGLLQAYALDAMATGGTLVIKGPRKGGSIKDFVEDSIASFNSVDGLTLASMEMNPNLYDMFEVKVVPSIVITTRANLTDIGSGCESPETMPQMAAVDHLGQAIQVPKPTCLPAASETYFKISGAVTTLYALDAFERAGANPDMLKAVKLKMAQRFSDPLAKTADGAQMQSIAGGLRLAQLPPRVLQAWRNELQANKVQRSELGPVFTTEGPDDLEYRLQLLHEIDTGLHAYAIRVQNGEAPALE